jgi:hypothetical protein
LKENFLSLKNTTKNKLINIQTISDMQQQQQQQKRELSHLKSHYCCPYKGALGLSFHSIKN